MQEAVKHQRMAAGGFKIESRREIDHGKQFRYQDGTIINYYKSGKLLVQGPNPGPALKALEFQPLQPKPSSPTQFPAPRPEPTRYPNPETRRMYSAPGDKTAITTPEPFRKIGLDPDAPSPNRHPDWNPDADPDTAPF
jgi:hypothetical protein